MDTKIPANINISTQTFLKLILIVFIIGFLFLVKEVLALIFISLILASAFDPWVDWFHRHKFPLGLAIIVIYVVIISVVATCIILIVPPISKEVGQVAKNFPFYYEKIMQSYNYFRGATPLKLGNEVQQGLNTLSSNLPGAVTNVFSTIFSVFGGIISFFIILVITFYFTVEEEGLKKFLKSVSPSRYQPYIMQLMVRIQRKMGLWLRGQMILSLIIFSLVFIGLSIMHVQYALLLALIAGIFEIVPFLGPALAAIPAVFFGFLQSPLMGFLVIGLYFIIQQLENHVIVPKVMGKTVDLNPLVIIVVILMGAKLGGFVGALISVPVATALSVFLGDFFDKKIEQEIKLEE